MYEKRLTKLLLLPLLLAGWMPLAAFADPLPLPPGPLDTNVFNTNNLVIPSDVQFLLHDLQTNIDQLRPFLAVINGETLTNASTNGIAAPPPPAIVPGNHGNDNAHGTPLIYGLGAALENVQTDLQELLPRLAALVGHTNYPGNSVSTNNTLVPNHLQPTNSAPRHPIQIQHSRSSTTPLSDNGETMRFFAQTRLCTPRFRHQPCFRDVFA
jgi:hypothetical protein